MNPLTTFLLLLLALWSSIHIIYRFYPTTNKPSHAILPTSLTRRKSTTTTVTLKGPYLRIESTALNPIHESLTLWLSQNSRAARARRAVLRVAFDLGIAVSLLGMVIALALLAWTLVQLSRRLVPDDLFSRPTTTITDVSYSHAKRAYEYDNVPPPSTFPARPTPAIPIQLLIPGITLPFSQLPWLLGALFFSQAIHEAGHALSAALDGVPLQSLGASLTLIVPTAFVAFPTHILASQSPPQVRARVAASGPLLSALLYLVLILALPLARLFLLVGYSNISAHGLLVASVTPDSPLSSHLPRGALLTALDDLSLANAKESTWSDYLTTPSPPDESAGWCLDTKWFLGHSHGCCAAPPPASGSKACLIPLQSEETPRCVEAPDFLVPTNNVVTRCEGSCAHGQTCARMREGEEFLRIGIQSDGYKTPIHVVLWRGTPEEIYQTVDVTSWRPRLPLLPFRLPNLVEKMILYTRTLTLSLFVLNVLPLPQLDGGVLLDAVLSYLDLIYPDIIDLESGSRGMSLSSRRLRSRLLSRLLRGLTMVLLCGCVLLGTYDSILRIYVQPSG